ncbi:hypothetical protein CBR_g57754, partial [Chara braunii]
MAPQELLATGGEHVGAAAQANQTKDVVGMVPEDLLATGKGRVDAASNKGLDAVSTSYSRLPLIDISPLMAKGEALSEEDLKDPDVAAVVRQIDKTCREIGFFYL